MKIFNALFAALLASTIFISGCNDSSDSNTASTTPTPAPSTGNGSTSSALDKAINSTDVAWTRLRPLDQNPANDSGVALGRACIPSETVIYNGQTLHATGDSRHSISKGDFITCIDNTDDGKLVLVDARAEKYEVSRDAVNSTKNFPSSWLAHDREFLVWAYDRDTIIFRDAMSTSFEGNFFYLLLDRDDAGNIVAGLMVDSGVGYANLAPYIYPLIGDKPLTVVNTHSHWDHYGGNTYLKHLPNVKFYGYQPGDAYNGYAVYPEYSLAGLFDQTLPVGTAQTEKTLQIGKRNVLAMLDPGHTSDTVILYDERTKILFTSDTVCHCGAFVEYWPEYRGTLEKLIGFKNQNEVKWALGGHLEFSKPRSWNGLFEYFLFGTNTHVEENDLQVDPSEMDANLVQLKAYESKQNNAVNPSYDTDEIDKAYHARPFTLIPFPDISHYYRYDDRRMTNLIKARQAAFIEKYGTGDK